MYRLLRNNLWNKFNSGYFLQDCLDNLFHLKSPVQTFLQHLQHLQHLRQLLHLQIPTCVRGNPCVSQQHGRRDVTPNYVKMLKLFQKEKKTYASLVLTGAHLLPRTINILLPFLPELRSFAGNTTSRMKRFLGSVLSNGWSSLGTWGAELCTVCTCGTVTKTVFRWLPLFPR